MHTPRVNHLYHCLGEEAGEIAQVAGKCGRFGADDHHPKTDNIPCGTLLVTEINDLLGVLEMLIEEGQPIPLHLLGNRDMIDAKKRRVLKYMDYATERGML